MARTHCLLSLIIVLVLAVSLVPSAAAQDDAFTVQVDEALRPAFEVLFSARYDGAQPTVVDSGADLLVTADAAALEAAADGLPDYFLPGAGIVPLTDNTEAAAFVAFAVSPDGQQALIDAGLLPAVVTVTDQAGKTVEVPQPVRGVITPFGITTFLVYGAGGQDRILAGVYIGARGEPGATRMAQIDPDFPAKSTSSMSQREINVEEVAALDPDVILAGARSQWLDAVAELNIPVVLFQGETPETLKEAVRIVGQILGPNAAAHAEAWIAYYDSVFTQVTGATAALDSRPAVMFSGSEPLRIASGEMYQSFMIEAAGGRSVSRDLTGYWNDLNLEQIALWNPEVIFTTSYDGASAETLVKETEWQVIAAVKEGRVYRLPAYVAPWDLPIPESVLGIIWMTDVLYPDLVDLECSTETDYFYRTFYHYTLTEDEIAALCGF